MTRELVDKYLCFVERCCLCYPNGGGSSLEMLTNIWQSDMGSYPKELNLVIVNWSRNLNRNASTYIPGYTASYPRIRECFYYLPETLKFHISYRWCRFSWASSWRRQFDFITSVQFMSYNHVYCLNLFNSYMVFPVWGGEVVLRARNVTIFIFGFTLQHDWDHPASLVPSVAAFWFHLFQAVGNGEKTWRVSEGSPWLYQQGTVIKP